MYIDKTEKPLFEIDSNYKLKIYSDRLSIDKYMRDYRRKIIIPFSQIKNIILKYPCDISFPDAEKSGYIVFELLENQKKNIDKVVFKVEALNQIINNNSEKDNFLSKTLKNMKAIKILGFLNLIQFSADDYPKIVEIKSYIENRIEEEKADNFSNSELKEVILKEKTFTAAKLFIYINLIAFGLLLFIGLIFYIAQFDIKYFGKAYYTLVIISIVIFLYSNYKNSKTKDW